MIAVEVPTNGSRRGQRRKRADNAHPQHGERPPSGSLVHAFNVLPDRAGVKVAG